MHYGISLQWGPNCCSTTPEGQSGADKLVGDLRPGVQGQDHGPGQPDPDRRRRAVSVKDAADLGITDPYELTQDQFDAAVTLLKQQRPLIRKYWALASDEIDLFENGDAVVGAAWPYQTITLLADKAPVSDLIPKEGATGWADTWMLSAKAKHPNCAYEWMKWVSTPQVQAQQAISFGETPANMQSCSYMDKIQGACAQYHANAPASYFDSIKFWKTPTQTAATARPTARTTASGNRSGQRSRGDRRSRLHSLPAGSTARSRVSAALFPAVAAGHAAAQSPAAWFVLIYIAALVVLFISAFWQVDPFTSDRSQLHAEELQHAVLRPDYRTIALRTIGIAAAVTLTDAIVARPFAYFAARIANKRLQAVLFVLVLIPLWSSYLVRVYAWRLILAKTAS